MASGGRRGSGLTGVPALAPLASGAAVKNRLSAPLTMAAGAGRVRGVTLTLSVLAHEPFSLF